MTTYTNYGPRNQDELTQEVETDVLRRAFHKSSWRQNQVATVLTRYTFRDEDMWLVKTAHKKGTGNVRTWIYIRSRYSSLDTRLRRLYGSSRPDHVWSAEAALRRAERAAANA